MLDAFHPGRIDLGLGRSGQRRRDAAKRPAAEQRRAAARVARGRRGGRAAAVRPARLLRNPRLRRADGDTAAARSGFTRLRRAGRRHPGDAGRQLPHRRRRGTRGPGRTGRTRRGSSAAARDESAQVAGARGLPFVASYHITPATALEAIDAYRDAFTPSARLAEPYVVVSADVVVADDTATARHLASSYGHWVYSIRAGDGAMPYPDPDACPPLTDEQLAVVEDRIATQFVGDRRRGGPPAGGAAAGHRRRRAGDHLGHPPARGPAAFPRADRQTLGTDGG